MRSFQPKDMNDEEYFFSFIVKNEVTGCWLFENDSKTREYAQKAIGGSYDYVHRWSYRHFVGAIPKGKQIAHHCDNPVCVNPKHLYVATASQNRLDTVRRRRNAKGYCMTSRETVEGIIRALQSDTKGYLIAKKFDVTGSVVSRINSGRSHCNVMSEVKRPIRDASELRKRRAQ